MKEFFGIGGATAAIVLMATQSASAAPTQVTNVRLNPSRSGVDVVLETQAGERAPQVFNVNRGNTWTAYVFNTQLRGNQSFQQNNPAPGIASISVTPVGANGIQVTVVGQGNTAPTGQIASRNAQGVILSVSGTGSARTPVAQAQAPAQAPASKPAPIGVPIEPLVPNPTITTTPPTVPMAPVPPFLPRAVAPPVGDITVAPIDVSPSSIDLGSAERIPRLVLRDAPVREVLSLLARAAGLNLAYSESPSGQAGAVGQAARSGGPTISLDIENESVQDVFNYVLRLACVPVAATGQGGGSQCGSLEATRSGRTIFVGTRLPNAARGAVARSLRLNQISVSSAVNFLVGLGAESAVTRERQVRTVVAQSASQLEGAQQGTTNNQPATTETTTETRVEVQRAEFRDSTPLLRGMQVSGDERTNSITLIGTARQIELATSQLVQLDSRRRMVAVNVKVIDVNLLALRRFGTTFSFGVGNSQVVNQGGIAVLNFGSRTPGTSSATSDVTGSSIGTIAGIANGSPINFVRSFFAQLQASVVSGNAKILTDPTLVVQEGQTATVNLTQEVITNFTQNVTSAGQGAVATVTVTAEKRSAGLILPVKVDRIDDNGFISLSVAPSISQPESTQTVNIGGASNIITLLSERKLESGQIRLRDGQTLVLSGIIQEQDRTTVTKVPILGDIPILGALFRRTDRNNQRREVIVLLSPQIIDDSDRSTFGYGYTPGPEVRQVLQQDPGSR